MSCIPEFRKVLFSLCQELTTENLRSLKYLLRDLLTTRELEDIRDPMDLMLYLEQRNELCSNNCQLLEDLLTQIKRKDLVQKIQAFQGGLLNNHKTTLSAVSLQNKIRTRDCVTDGREGPSHPKDNSDYFTFVTCTRRKFNLLLNSLGHFISQCFVFTNANIIIHASVPQSILLCTGHA